MSIRVSAALAVDQPTRKRRSQKVLPSKRCFSSRGISGLEIVRTRSATGFTAKTLGISTILLGVCMSEPCRNSLRKGLQYFAGTHLITNQLEKPLPPSGFGLFIRYWIFPLRGSYNPRRCSWANVTDDTNDDNHALAVSRDDAARYRRKSRGRRAG